MIITDLGETLRWLRSQTLAARRTTKQNALLGDICLTHGVELFKGMLIVRCHPGDALAAVMTRLAQACLRVSDLWFTFRTRAVQSVTDEVVISLFDDTLDVWAENHFKLVEDLSTVCRWSAPDEFAAVLDEAR